MSIRQDIEVFHILFCKSLLTTQDKSLIVLKGGCNLRFFLGSNRYSEDIDFDIATIARGTLQKRVDKVLAGQPFRAMLAARKIEIVTHSAPKQTDTVQRWKVTLRTRGIDLPTKIEFSRRGIDRDGTNFASIDPLVLAEHNLTPTFLTHYNAQSAIAQKIEALAGRPQTQARDVYDLALLLARYQGPLRAVSEELVVKATSCAMGIDYDQFRGQVVEFLADDAKEFYSTSASWEALQLQVIAALERLPRESE